ncbi:hypothetical protein SEMRO_1585_G284060.1 [Seminavis robusta]|uniref:Uncharacterized protein n=1 Tax=Seminavis robusta TaxID=568900 RepID=A0A9N8HU14_9STRA|nr:hypothetical protein SEMRO_1585_G284060.1 [Seminavis robusta]|eukprot:Sro1585_g284060.1 n/a (481) ;mRNA; r:4381-5823
MAPPVEDSPAMPRKFSDIPFAELGAVHPDGNAVGPAERFYKCSGEKYDELMAMGIGLNSEDSREIGNIDIEPYKSMKLKKKVTPTQKNMVDEIKRRAYCDGITEPKCVYWERKKCLAWLKAYPVTNPNDCSFIIAEEKKLFNLINKATQEKLDEKKEKASSWTTVEPYLRLIECMMDDSIRDKFLDMQRIGDRDELDARNSDNRPETIFEACSRLFNDPEKEVYSQCLPDLHYSFAEVLDCCFEKMPGLVTPDEVKRRWGDCRAKLIKIIAKWELSGNGFGQRHEGEDEFGHMGEDEMECGDNRANFLDSQTKEHILYLWHVSDEQQILKNVMCVIAESSAASSEICSSVAGTDQATSARKRRTDERALGFFRAKMSLAMHTMSRAAIFKELRETQEKLFEAQLRVMEVSNAEISEMWMGRVRYLEAQVAAVKECLDSLALEEEEQKPAKKKKRKVVISPLTQQTSLESDSDEEEDNEED